MQAAVSILVSVEIGGKHTKDSINSFRNHSTIQMKRNKQYYMLQSMIIIF
jgi:hypothetical protein